MNNYSWKDAIEAVLRETGEAMHYTDIAEQIVERGLRESVGATPANTVAAVITTEIKENGPNATFIRSERGRYMLRRQDAQADDDEIAQEEEEEAGRIVRAFGMF